MHVYYIPSNRIQCPDKHSQMPRDSRTSEKPWWNIEPLLSVLQFRLPMECNPQSCAIAWGTCVWNVPKCQRIECSEQFWRHQSNKPEFQFWWTYLLLHVRILFVLMVIEWIFLVRIIHGPFDEMISQIEATIIVCTIFKINDYQIWFPIIRWRMWLST